MARVRWREDRWPRLGLQQAVLAPTIWFAFSFQGLWLELRQAFVYVHFFHQWPGWQRGPGVASDLITHPWRVKQQPELRLELLAELRRPVRCFDS